MNTKRKILLILISTIIFGTSWLHAKTLNSAELGDEKTPLNLEWQTVHVILFDHLHNTSLNEAPVYLNDRTRFYRFCNMLDKKFEEIGLEYNYKYYLFPHRPDTELAGPTIHIYLKSWSFDDQMIKTQFWVKLKDGEETYNLGFFSDMRVFPRSTIDTVMEQSIEEAAGLVADKALEKIVPILIK